jgi:hypothetical protein
MLQAYYDASGKPDLGHVTVAGWMSTPGGWADFGVRWNEALAQFGVPYFHASTFAGSQGPFAEWRNDESRKRDFIERLATIMRETVLFGISSTMYYADFAAADKLFGIAAVYRNAFVLAARDCMKRFDAHAFTLRGPRNREVAHIFESGDEGSGYLREICRQEGARPPQFHPSTPNHDGIPHLVQLQSADFAAYECFRLVQQRPKFNYAPVPIEAARPPVALLNEIPNEWKVYDLRSLSLRALFLDRHRRN